jgi:hypothetical protein
MPILVAKYVLKHPTLIMVLFFGVLLLFGVRTCTTSTTTAVPIPEYQESAPAVPLAPTVIATTSRVYYVADYSAIEGGYLLTDYYSYDGGSWVRIPAPLELETKYYGEIKVYERITN